MAEREGFEPSVRVSVHTLSRRAPSATRTPLQVLFFEHIWSKKERARVNQNGDGRNAIGRFLPKLHRVVPGFCGGFCGEAFLKTARLLPIDVAFNALIEEMTL